MSPAKSKKPALTKGEIVQAARRVLDRHGYDALTIRNVAAEIGVKSASLYWHFDTKEELVDALADALLEGIQPDQTKSKDWKEDLRLGSRRMMQHLLSVRDSGRLLAGRLLTGPNSLRWMEMGLAPFLEAGLGKRDVAYASHAIHVYVQGFVIFQSAPLSSAELKGAARSKVLADTRKRFQNLSRQAFPNIVSLAGALTDEDGQARFLFGLDCLIAGIEQRARVARRRSATRVSKRHERRAVT